MLKFLVKLLFPRTKRGTALNSPEVTTMRKHYTNKEKVLLRKELNSAMSVFPGDNRIRSAIVKHYLTNYYVQIGDPRFISDVEWYFKHLKMAKLVSEEWKTGQTVLCGQDPDRPLM